MSRLLSDTEIGHLVANRDESGDDIECSDDENEIFNNENDINHNDNDINDNFEPDIEIDIDSLPIVFDTTKGVRIDVCEPGTSSYNSFIDTSTKSNTYDMTTSFSPTVKHSVKSKTLHPKISLPNFRDCWGEHLGLSRVYNFLSQKRFEEIRRFLHFNDNSKMLEKDNIHYDRLYKIIDHLNNKFNSIPNTRDLSLDEQFCAAKARSFSYQFEIYSDQENDQRFRSPNEPDIGASSNIVVRLTRNVPRHKNHSIYFENIYTSIPLAAYLHKNGILCLGIVRKDRLPNNKIPSDQIIQKDVRGKSYEYLTVFENAPHVCDFMERQ
ncbi:piggyBac transposable element-derived protein 4-like [Aphis craccivora]|uniref:PiggyBac transposable element-derived protein 4-like n=1 Tax=Aphis craccivora TaxID=307492 RepID=A0A6G0XWU6_APHCR|nr:piggyBac transposable element-derived protein 4-like [Aphis craccivora]